MEDDDGSHGDLNEDLLNDHGSVPPNLIDNTSINTDLKPSSDNEMKTPSMTREQKVLFLTFGFSSLMTELSFSILAPFFPGEAAKQGATPSQIGLIFGFYSLVQFVTSPIVGKFLPLIGGRFMYISGNFISAGCNILFGFLGRVAPGTQFVVFCFVIRGLEAVGAAAMMTSYMALVANKFPNSVAQTMGNIEIFAGIGLTLGPFLGGVLYQVGGFMLPFVTLGGLTMTVSLALIFIIPIDTNTCNKKTGSYVQVMSIPGTWVGIVSIFIGTASLTFFEPTLSTELKQYDSTISPTQIGLVFLAMGVAYAFSAPICGWIADKHKNTRTLLFFGYVLACIAYLIVGPWPVLHLPKQLWIICIGATLIYVALGCAITPTYQDILTTVLYNGMSDEISTHSIISGIFNCAYSLGSFFGPTIGAFMVVQLGFAMSSTLFGALNLVTACGILGFSLWEFRCGKVRRKTMYVARYRVQSDDSEQLLND